MDSTKRRRDDARNDPSTSTSSPHAHKAPRHTPPQSAAAIPPAAPQQLEINYLARFHADDLPVVNQDDSLPYALHLLNSYSEVIDRSESLASNLGAKPLGTILVKRFERLFDGSPRVVRAAPDGKRATVVTWLDVAQFAGTSSAQYDIVHLTNGKRVCQFSLKNCTVQINEEDWLMIKSGLPQNIIPPQPIAEDEEKELGTLEILETAVSSISSLADQVAARARQFNHRLKARKQAIIERRMAQTSFSGSTAVRTSSPSNIALVNGEGASSQLQLQSSPPSSSSARLPDELSQELHTAAAAATGGATSSTPTAATAATVSHAVRDELQKSFSATRQGISSPTPARRPGQTPVSPSHGRRDRASSNPFDPRLAAADLARSAPTLPRDPQAHAAPPRNPAPDDGGGPFRALMLQRLELLPRHERIFPPCDRCRRLRIDCLKNLSACAGCTRKHTRCAWRDVAPEEVEASEPHYHHHHRSDYAPAAADLAPAQPTQQDAPEPPHPPDAPPPGLVCP